MRVASGVLALLLATGSTASAQETEPAEVVRFTFAWPDEVDARVTVERYRIRSADGRVDTTSTSLAYRMEGRPIKDGILVASSDFEVPGATAPLMSAAVDEYLGSMMPSLIVDRSGQFVRVTNIEQMVESLRRLMGPVPDDARAAIDRHASAETLTALSAQDWNSYVGFWIDAELEVGAAYEMENEVELPFVPGSRVPMYSEIVVTGRVDCVEGSLLHDCVEASVVTWPDADATAHAIEQFLKGFTPGEPVPFQIQTLDLETQVFLITDPNTLQPHFYQETRWVSGHAIEDDTLGSFSQTDVKTYTWTWE